MTRTVPSLSPEHRAICATMYGSRPDWVAGTISYPDAQYLFSRVLSVGADPTVEIGTASGVSTAIIATALDEGWSATRHGDPPGVFTYDIAPDFYANHTHRTGDATREMVPPDLLERITFRLASAAALSDEHGPDSISFLFLDANHRHPMPALDLLAAIDALRPGAEVALHDINLPRIRPDTADWGAKWVFEGLDLQKHVDPDEEVPNIGSVIVPDDKAELRDQLLELVYAHPWETEVAPEYLAEMLAGADPTSGEEVQGVNR